MTITRGDIDNIYGPTNVIRWADLENKGDPLYIDNRITWAIALASSYVYAKMANGPYVVPFADPEPILIVDIIARRAGLELYSSRGIEDENDRMLEQGKRVERDINALLTDVLRLTDVERNPITYPQNVSVSGGHESSNVEFS